MNHATAQMNHKLAHQTAFHQDSIGAPLSDRLLKRLEFTRKRCEETRGSKGPLWSSTAMEPQHVKMDEVRGPKGTVGSSRDVLESQLFQCVDVLAKKGGGFPCLTRTVIAALA